MVSESPSVPAEGIPGDFDGDGKVDISDLSNLSLALVDNKELAADVKNRMDVDHDGKVSLADLATLRQYISKVIEKL